MTAALECTSYDVDFSTGEVVFNYVLADGPRLRGFTERMTLPLPQRPATDETAAAVRAVLSLAHLVAGISYAKAAAATTIRVSAALTKAELDLLRGVYRDGMHEFAYTNDLPAVLDTEVEAEVVADPAPLHFPSDPAIPLVACGGGKDSIVTLEALRRAGHSPVSFVVNPNEITRSVVERSATTLLAVSRRLDPQLFELNAAGAYNGHVPVTALNSLLGVGVAVLHGLGPVVMSNESSASAPNLTWHGRPVNHQWSKGIDAERLLRAALTSRLGPDERYFSLLRHLNELSIAELFSRITAYDDVVTSCNRAFTITKTSGQRWCRDCPKCRFVFLALACFAPRERVVGIFGGDMLRDPAQLTGYRELLGLIAFKPFECVGELDESVAAAAHLATLPDWAEAPVVAALAGEISSKGAAVPTLASVLAQRGPSLAPSDYLVSLDALD